MKKIAILFLLLPLMTFSQETGRKPMRVHVISAIGTQAGESGLRPAFLVSGGIAFNKYFTGAGAAYDLYRFRSVPVFADWRYYPGKKRLFYLYANPGYNFAVGHYSDEAFLKTADRMKGGFYIDAGTGLNLPVGSAHHLSLSVGYSQKNMTHKQVYEYPYLCSTCGETTTTDVYRYSLGRMVTKLSWEIGK